MTGPLAGMKVVELAGIGPGPMCAMLLADLGATVIRVDRKQPVKLGIERPLKFNTLLRNRGAIALDLKDPRAVETVLELVEQADALIEGFRPGVTERLGLGPDVCLARNPRLAYGRLTGWGQSGPLAQVAGHDINYLALTGILDAIGREGQPPSIPLNLRRRLCRRLAVHGGRPARRDPRGAPHRARARSSTRRSSTAPRTWRPPSSAWSPAASGSDGRGSNLTDGGSHFYDCYECADGRWIAVGPIEEKFFAELLAPAGDRRRERSARRCRASTGSRPRRVLAATFKTRTRDDWAALLEHTDACVSPVLSFAEAHAAPAPEGARHLRRDRRHRAVRAGAALLAQRARHADAAAAGHAGEHRPGLVGLVRRRTRSRRCGAHGVID